MFRTTCVLVLAVAVAVTAVTTAGARASEPAASEDTTRSAATRASAPLHLSFELGGTAVSTNNVLPFPGPGVGLLLEHGHFGISAAMHVDFLTLCDHGTASDSHCGVLWLWDVTPRLTLLPDQHWSPYVAGRLQLARDELHGLVPAVGPRIGFRYRGEKIGLYAEAGPSFVRAQDSQFTARGSSWFPQLSTGMTFPWL